MSLSSHKIICVFGQKGVGKSELVKYVSDCINKLPYARYLPPEIRSDLKALGHYYCLYIDIVDGLSWQGVVDQLSFALVNEICDTIENTARMVNTKWSKRKLIICLDNVNNLATANELVKGISRYQHVRPADRFVIGSINCLIDPQVGIFPIELQPFTLNHCCLFLKKRGLALKGDELKAVLAVSAGLPLFLNLLGRYQQQIMEAPNSFQEFFVSQIFAKLDQSAQELLIFLSLCNLSVTSISSGQLPAFAVLQ